MARFTALIASVVALLALALPAAIAVADYGDGGGGTWDPCSFAVCRWVVAGRVADAATGAPVAGATVTLQMRAAGGEWAAPPSEADLRPAANPLSADAAGRFTWLARGGADAQVRVVVAREGYVTQTSAARDLRADGALDVALIPVPGDAPDAPGSPDAPATPVVPAPAPVGGAGGPVVPAPAAPRPTAPKAGCAAKPAKARAACRRAAALAKALKACRVHKGSRRATCERRARALSACDAKTGRKRATCRAQARRIGRPAKRRR